MSAQGLRTFSRSHVHHCSVDSSAKSRARDHVPCNLYLNRSQSSQHDVLSAYFCSLSPDLVLSFHNSEKNIRKSNYAVSYSFNSSISFLTVHVYSLCLTSASCRADCLLCCLRRVTRSTKGCSSSAFQHRYSGIWLDVTPVTGNTDLFCSWWYLQRASAFLNSLN